MRPTGKIRSGGKKRPPQPPMRNPRATLRGKGDQSNHEKGLKKKKKVPFLQAKGEETQGGGPRIEAASSKKCRKKKNVGSRQRKKSREWGGQAAKNQRGELEGKTQKRAHPATLTGPTKKRRGKVTLTEKKGGRNT